LILKRRVRRDGLKTGVVGKKKIVWRYTLQPIAIAKSEAQPKTGGLGPSGECPVFPPALAAIEISNKTNQFCFRKRHFDQASTQLKELQALALQPAGHLHEPCQRFAVETHYQHLLVGRNCQFLKVLLSNNFASIVSLAQCIGRFQCELERPTQFLCRVQSHPQVVQQ